MIKLRDFLNSYVVANNIDKSDFTSPSRKRMIVDARMIYCVVARNLGGYTLSEIGKSIPEDKLSKRFSDTLSNVNKSLVNYKKISTLIIVKDNWTQENGIVGPTQKLKRGAVDEKYNKNYLSWHESGKNIIFEGTF